MITELWVEYSNKISNKEGPDVLITYKNFCVRQENQIIWVWRKNK